MVGPIKARFLAINKHARRKSLYFENTMNVGSSKSAKIVVSKSIF